MGLKPGRQVYLGDLLIDVTVSTTISSVLQLDGHNHRWKQGFDAILIDGPGTLSGTATLQVSHSDEDMDVYGTTWRDVQSAGSDVTVAADGSVQVNSPLGRRIRIKSNSAEAVNRRFRVYGVENAS